MRVSRMISIYRAQRSQQGCSLSLGMLRLAEPPTGRARLRSSLKSPRNPITPFETSRVSTLHPGLYKNLRDNTECRRARDARPYNVAEIETVRHICNVGLHHCNRWTHFQQLVATPYPVGARIARPFISDVITTFREGARRVIGATAKPLYAIEGKAYGLDRRLLKPTFIDPPPHFFCGFFPFRYTCAGRPECGYPPPPRCLRDSGQSRSSRRFAGACRRSRRVGSVFRR